MRNIVKLRGQFLEQLPFEDRGEFVVRVHSDASFNNQRHRASGYVLPVIGYGYCVELAPYAPKDSIPAYGYGSKVIDVNDCSTSAELIGIINALKEMNLTSNVEIICDNRDAVNIINHVIRGHRAKEFQVNPVMRSLIVELEAFIGQGITARWVRGHNGDIYNHAVNSLARMARRNGEDVKNLLHVAKKESNMLATFRQMSEAMVEA